MASVMESGLLISNQNYFAAHEIWSEWWKWECHW